MDCKEERNRILKEVIYPPFKKEGFKKSGNNIFKNEGSFIKVFSLENSSWNEFDYVNFWFRSGISFPVVYKLKRQEPPKSFTASGCHFLLTPTSLMNESWNFVIQPETEISKIEAKILEIINNHIIPFFKEIKTPKDCLKINEYINSSYWSDVKPFISLTLIDSGAIEFKKQLFEELEKSNYIEAFKNEIREFSNKLIRKSSTK